MDEARNLVTRLDQQRRAAGRARPVEVTLSLRTGNAITLDEIHQLGTLGVERTLIGMPLRAMNESDLERFRDDVMAKI